MAIYLRGLIITIVVCFSISAYAGSIVPCGDDECTSNFSIYVGNNFDQEVGGGQIIYDAETGDIRLDLEGNIRGGGMSTGSGLMWNMGNGGQIRVSSVYGNADPILGFGLGATTGASAQSFAFAFDLPISIGGQIEVASSISYSLTSLSNAGAQIQPAFTSTVLTASDVDNDIGGLGALDKEVDVGERFFFTGGPQTMNSPVYTANSIISGSTDYDMMSVLISFNLSANSSVGISGFVSQEEFVVPLPAALPLYLAGLLGIGFLKGRRRQKNNN
ncbi:MAG: VPLPA-CTERM sorting domain-containing protein [Cellvibrionaceae bacterium]